MFLRDRLKGIDLACVIHPQRCDDGTHRFCDWFEFAGVESYCARTRSSEWHGMAPISLRHQANGEKDVDMKDSSQRGQGPDESSQRVSEDEGELVED